MPTNCTNCGNSVPDGFRFCGMCGSPIQPASSTPSKPLESPSEELLSDVSQDGPRPKAMLVLIKGEGFDVVTYHLNSDEHVIGSLYGTILFPDDRFLSPRHANIFYRDDRLVIRDEGSHNGVYIKISEPVILQDGDTFLAGEQLIRFDVVDQREPMDVPNEEGTRFYGCPADDKVLFRLTHLFREGEEGAVLYAVRNTITVGRERCDLSFPHDRHISGRHCKVFFDGDNYVLQDLGSKNGTFHRLKEERLLSDGDYLFVGQQLMRVEIS